MIPFSINLGTSISTSSSPNKIAWTPKSKYEISFDSSMNLSMVSEVVPSIPLLLIFCMKGITVVIPPKAALKVKESILSKLIGWLCASIKPGSTYNPLASMILFASILEGCGKTSVIFSPVTTTSIFVIEVPLTNRPPEIKISAVIEATYFLL